MKTFKVRYLVLKTLHIGESPEKQTIVERIRASTTETAKLHAEDLATMRSKSTEKWLVKSITEK